MPLLEGLYTKRGKNYQGRGLVTRGCRGGDVSACVLNLKKGAADSCLYLSQVLWVLLLYKFVFNFYEFFLVCQP